jgi:hypothetical protein
MTLLEVQQAICWKYEAVYVPSEDHLKVGLSTSVKQGARPLHGLRQVPEGTTTGWYIWAGEYATADDFFHPLHVAHVVQWAPELHPYLGLGPGWRFLLVPEVGYADVWFDESLLA